MKHKRAWIYCRTAHPDNSMHTLEIQQASMEAFAGKQGFEIVGTTAE